MYNYIDFGSGDGDSIRNLKEMYPDMKTGYGIEFNKKKVEEVQRKGYDVRYGDITIPIKDKARIVSIRHVLEHIPTLPLSLQVVDNTIEVATEQVYIEGPNFDKEEELKALGLKLSHNDWIGHPNHLTTWQLAQHLDKRGVQYYVDFVRHIPTSNDKFIVPLTAPTDTIYYDAKIHGPRTQIELLDVYDSFRCIIDKTYKPDITYSNREEQLVETLKQVKKRDNILYIGANERYHRYLGAFEGHKVDVVEVQEQHYNWCKVSGLFNECFHSDIVDFIPNKHYDMIVAMHIFEHLYFEQAIQTIHRLKQHCNYLLIATPFGYAPNLPSHIGPDKHKTIFTPMLYKYLFKGFKISIVDAGMGKYPSQIMSLWSGKE